MTDHTCHGAIFTGTPRPRAYRECPACSPSEPVYSDRGEGEICEAGTTGCCIDHTASPAGQSCEGF